MEENSKAWDVYDTLEVDENGIPIMTTSSSFSSNTVDTTDEEPHQKVIALHRNETSSDEMNNGYRSVTLPHPRKLNLPDEVVGIIKNGIKSTISFNITVEIDMIPENIIDFLSQSYNIQKEDVVKDIVELSFDEDEAKEILSRGIIKELWK